MRFARDQYAEQVTLDQMGQIAGEPIPAHQAVQQDHRPDPHAYLTQLRLKAAIRHLRSGLPLAEAAVAAGYDQSALNNHFKRAFGMTPLQYLRACDL
jgi:methylphosphotriester-DNA--protein-cysteine methyltransferase